MTRIQAEWKEFTLDGLRTSRNKGEWDALCDVAKTLNGGQYPEWWNEHVVLTGLEAAKTREWEDADRPIPLNLNDEIICTPARVPESVWTKEVGVERKEDGRLSMPLWHFIAFCVEERITFQNGEEPAVETDIWIRRCVYTHGR